MVWESLVIVGLAALAVWGLNDFLNSGDRKVMSMSEAMASPSLRAWLTWCLVLILKLGLIFKLEQEMRSWFEPELRLELELNLKPVFKLVLGLKPENLDLIPSLNPNPNLALNLG